MAVETVASGNNAFAQQATAPRAEQQRKEQPAPPSESKQVKPAEQSAPRAEEKKSPPVETQKKPPVVNIQGQTTGRIVNTSA